MEFSGRKKELVRKAIIKSQRYNSNTHNLDDIISYIFGKADFMLSSIKNESILNKYLSKLIEEYFDDRNNNDNNDISIIDLSVNKNDDSFFEKQELLNDFDDINDFLELDEKQDTNIIKIINISSSNKSQDIVSNNTVNKIIPFPQNYSNIGENAKFELPPDDDFFLTPGYDEYTTDDNDSSFISNELGFSECSFDDNDEPFLDINPENQDENISFENSIDIEINTDDILNLPNDDKCNSERTYSIIDDPISEVVHDEMTLDISNKIITILLDMAKIDIYKLCPKIFYLKYIKKLKKSDIAKKLDITEDELSKIYFDMVKQLNKKLYS